MMSLPLLNEVRVKQKLSDTLVRGGKLYYHMTEYIDTFHDLGWSVMKYISTLDVFLLTNLPTPTPI